MNSKQSSMNTPSVAHSRPCSTEEREKASEAQAHTAHACALIKCTTCILQNPATVVVADLREFSVREEESKDCYRDRARVRRQHGQQTCLHCISPSSITLNRKVIDYEQSSAVASAGMHTTPDMLILSTCSNNQQTRKQHSNLYISLSCNGPTIKHFLVICISKYGWDSCFGGMNLAELYFIFTTSYLSGTIHINNNYGNASFSSAI